MVRSTITCSVVLLFQLLGAEGFAKDACQFISGKGRTPVVFFGGNKSTDKQVAAWSAAAQASQTYGQQFEFEAHSLHGAKSNLDAVLKSSSAEINRCVAEIDSPQFRGPVVLVGHSDGGWVINEIVKRVTPENRKKIKLVSLDGYAVTGPEFEGVSVQCWTAYNSNIQRDSPQSCGKIENAARSLSALDMSKCGPSNCKLLAESGCATNWCLHFKLINSKAPPKIGRDNYGEVGYDNVVPPLQYLDGILDQEPAGARPSRPSQRSVK